MSLSYVTAREILVRVAGREHELHTIIGMERPKGVQLWIKCSCGTKHAVDVTADNLLALRNVPEEVSL